VRRQRSLAIAILIVSGLVTTCKLGTGNGTWKLTMQ